MWKKQLPNRSFIDNCLQSIVAINRILQEGNYFAQTGNDEQNLKVSIEAETDTVLLEVNLHENTGIEFLASLKSNNLTKHIPVMIVTPANTQLFWDRLNMSGICFDNVQKGRNPWFMVKINSVIQ